MEKRKEKSSYEKGDLVLDFFEVVEYIGYEEHEDDNYHRLFSSEKGEYLQSAVVGPESIKESPEYERTLNYWKLNIERYKEDIEERTKLLKDFCENTEIHPDYKIWYRADNIISLFDLTMPGLWGEGPEHIDLIKVDTHHLKRNEEYSEFLTKYINTIIKKHLDSK